MLTHQIGQGLLNGVGGSHLLVACFPAPKIKNARGPYRPQAFHQGTARAVYCYRLECAQLFAGSAHC